MKKNNNPFSKREAPPAFVGRRGGYKGNPTPTARPTPDQFRQALDNFRLLRRVQVGQLLGSISHAFAPSGLQLAKGR